MKPRQAIFGAFFLAALAVIFLGLAGVFHREPPRPPVELRVPQGGGEARMEEVTLRVKAMDLTIVSTSLQADASGQRILHEPRLTMTHADKGMPDSKTLVTARADRGFHDPTNESAVRLAGGVEIEARGAHPGRAKAEDIAWNAETRCGVVRGLIAFEAYTDGGVQKGWCRDAEADLGRRHAVMKSEVRLLLSGYGRIEDVTAATPAGAPDAAGVATPPVEVRCDGPLTVEGQKRKAVLERRVRVTQQDTRLECERLEVGVADRQRQVESVLATGRVRLEAPGRSALMECDRLARDARRDVTELTGAPARVRVEAAEVVSERIVASAGGIETPQAGRLSLTAPRQGGGPAVLPPTIEWQGRMKLAQDRRRAEFERQVVFADEGRRVACDRLVLELDESGKELRRVAASGAVSFSDGERQIECKTLSVRMAGASDKDRAAVQQVEAAGDVKFRGQGASGVGEKLAISQAANDLRLTGSPALLQRGRESFRGAEIVARDGGARVESPGPGVMETALASGDAAQPADPVRVAWGKRMAFFQADDRAVFEGGVVLTRGRQSLRAETVEVRPQAQVFRAPGPGSMEVEAPAEGDQPAGQMEVSWRGSAEFVESERRAAFLGQVQMKRGDQEIRAESVAIALTEARQVKGLEAQGGVSLRDARRKVSAEGDRLAWDMAADNGKLWGADKKPASLSQPDQRPILADWIEFRDRFETIRMAGGRLE